MAIKRKYQVPILIIGFILLASALVALFGYGNSNLASKTTLIASVLFFIVPFAKSE